MVAHAAAKPTYKPSVKLVNIHTGDYRVSSSDGSAFYSVNVARITCTCKAGQTSFVSCKSLPYCKHVAAAKYWARCLHDTRQGQKEVAPAAASWGSQPAWGTEAATPAHANKPAVAALLECYPTAA